MHELSLSGAIVDTVVKHASGRQVSLVTLRVGQLRQVVPDTLEFYFGFVSQGTVCEGARLEQVVVPAVLSCCGRSWGIDAPDFRCASCGAAAVLAGGNEFEVESIEVEEVACTA
jgi:hydrogenase nickel incorporation protein HypA/HybF